MNYLAHAYLSFADAEILTGNMIADHVKGRIALEQYPAGIKKGIELHRKIDAFTDAHPATGRARLWFKEKYGLYSGPITDILYDHFLAMDPQCFPSATHLLKFTEDTYTRLETQANWFPEKFASYFPHMRTHNWLYGYRTLQGMQRSLQGLERRAQHLESTEAAYQTFIEYYYQLAQCYYELMDDVVKYVKVELTRQ
ncbi:MAG: ACP phosphodiesterase [Flavipsychrobacter sp.]|nr:ACP phosphodiesterase [Flavipsychrobacter sp.]